MLDDLSGAEKEKKRMLEIISQNQLDDLSPSNSTWSEVLDLLERGEYDLFHAAAHGNFFESAPDTDSALWLQKEHALTPSDLLGPSIQRHIGTERPVFFLNACQVGRQGWALHRIGGWANRLVSSGASVFVGPLWEVKDKTALAFSEHFYQGVLSGKTVAKATQDARLAARRDGDPTWAAYTVYAHPNCVVVGP